MTFLMIDELPEVELLASSHQNAFGVVLEFVPYYVIYNL